MKRHILTIAALTLAFAMGTQAQSLYMVNDSSFTYGDVNKFDIHDESVYIVNPDSGMKFCRWIRIYEGLPSGWQSLVCDKNECKGPTVSTDTFSIGMGQGLMWVHFQANGNLGDATVRVLIYDTNDSAANNVIGTWTAKITPVGIETNATFSNAYGVYPNPTNDMVYFSGNMTDVKAIEIFDVLGKRVVGYTDVTRQDGFNVGLLNTGMYFVRFVGYDDNIMSTQRMLKQ